MKGRTKSAMRYLRVMLISMGIIALMIIPALSSAEDEEVLREIRIKAREQLQPGDALFLFSRGLAELQTICEAVRYISYAQTSDEEYQGSVERHIRAAMKKLYGMMEAYENSPVMIKGFTIRFPFEIQVDFEMVQSD
jgi:RNase P/RNase MRP subunit POP5